MASAPSSSSSPPPMPTPTPTPTRILFGVNESSIRGYPHPSISSRTAFDWTLRKLIRSNAAGFFFLFLHVQVPDEDGHSLSPFNNAITTVPVPLLLNCRFCDRLNVPSLVSVFFFSFLWRFFVGIFFFIKTKGKKNKITQDISYTRDECFFCFLLLLF